MTFKEILLIIIERLQALLAKLHKMLCENIEEKNVEEPTSLLTVESDEGSYDEIPSLEDEVEKQDDETAETCLLDNAPYMKLAQQCCDMIEEIDRIEKQVPDSSLKGFFTQQKSRIREALFLSGASLIDEETEFNSLRHRNVGRGIIKKGTPIAETLEAGVEIDGRIMLKAKVKIEL